ncbi:MAG: DNA-directed RNA polymerase subunit E'' [Thermoplasmata archaeon]|nr:DNA-directed RNA polymerase subunit E'' [Thermoplasmata archaeon]|tara:strand:+ start:1732 stop:1965 length:234 start_codon:yes stop_codon:yes gene_type:complete
MIGLRAVNKLAKKDPLACGECHRILDDDQELCNAHPEAHCTSDWAGYVVILNPERSEIAEKLGITRAGNYALKVNIR